MTPRCRFVRVLASLPFALSLLLACSSPAGGSADLADAGLDAVDDLEASDVAPDVSPDVPPDLSGDLGPLPDWPARPALIATPADKAAVLARANVSPWSDWLTALRASAGTDCVPDTSDTWDVGAESTLAGTAQAAATLAWLYDDADAAARARDCLAAVRTDWETSNGLNHQMAGFSIPSAVAWDLLAGTALFPPDEAAAARDRLVEINRKFYERTVQDPAVRYGSLTVTQNNIALRTSAAMAYVALCFPDQPGNREILEFGAGEIDYLWGPDGRYLQADGVASEEPFYFGYGFPPPLALALAMRRAWPADGWLRRTCLNRNPKDPWAPLQCTEGQPWRWQDPLAPPGANPHADRFWGSFDWSLDHRLPSGLRSTTGDGRLRTQSAGLLLAGLSGNGRYAWDARHSPDGTVDMSRGLDLTLQHLVEVAALPPEAPPAWTSRAHAVSGHVTLRSGWDPDARWLLLLAESGPARKTLHDHADGTSFAFAAYGEYLLLDTGYYKPSAAANALTAAPPAHSVLLIDGAAGPAKGLLNAWGDTDAALDLFVDGSALDYAEVHEAYQKSTVHRSAVLVRDRYVVLADRVETTVTSPRTHAWRVHGYAGYDSGGAYALDQGATFERPGAGVRVAVASTAGQPQVQEPSYVQGEVPHVHDLGDGTTHHAVADAAVQAVAPGFLVVLAPWKAGAAATDPSGPLATTRLASADGAAAWLVQGTFGTDVVWLRDPGGPQTLALPDGTTLSTDADLVVVNPADGLLLHRGGTGVTWDGVLHAGAETAADLFVHDLP